jgi:hypothetical integral membrane protein (TIGR02206 family)
MKDFFAYFFGQGETEEFRIFTFAHLAPILVAAAAVYAIWHFREKIRTSRHERTFALVLAFAMIVSEMSYYWRMVGVPALEPTPTRDLPLSVCGWALILCSYMMVTRSQSLFDVAYFWLFSASIFAVITPTTISFTGPTRFRYYQFWCVHTLGYIGIFYMMFVHKLRPTVRSIIRSASLLAVLAVIAAVANALIGEGANYLFMARPESAPSILDILPPNYALRVGIMVLAIAALFFLAYLPWLLIDLRKKRTAHPAE